jgi:hypothetical protein
VHRAEVEQALLEGATANEFVGELWTLERIAPLIERLIGVRHHPAHVTEGKPAHQPCRGSC